MASIFTNPNPKAYANVNANKVQLYALQDLTTPAAGNVLVSDASGNFTPQTFPIVGALSAGPGISLTAVPGRVTIATVGAASYFNLQLATDITMVTGLNTIFTTPPLAAGAWILSINYSYLSESGYEWQLLGSLGSTTFPGAGSGMPAALNGREASENITCMCVLTAPDVVRFVCNSEGGGDQILAETEQNNYPRASGMFGYRIA